MGILSPIFASASAVLGKIVLEGVDAGLSALIRVFIISIFLSLIIMGSGKLKEVRICPAHAITVPTGVHPHVEPLLADLPPGWEVSLESITDDQGAVGVTPMPRLCRVVEP